MKFIFLLLIVAGVVLWVRQRSIDETEKAREAAEKAVAEERAKATPASSLKPSTTPVAKREPVATSLPAGGAKSNPGASAGDKVRDGFGWGTGGTALDQHPKGKR